MRARWATAVLLTASAALAEGSDFARLEQFAPLEQGDASAAASVEVQGAISRAQKGSSGGTGDAGYSGAVERIYGRFGVTDRIAVALEPTVRQTDLSTFTLQTLVPEVRVKLLSLPAGVLLSAFGDARLRLNGRRGSTAEVGLGLERKIGALALVANASFEHGAFDSRGTKGARYEAGASLRILEPLSLGLEAWGAFQFDAGETFQQDHHAGPTLKLRLGKRSWVSGNVAVGAKDRTNVRFIDWTALTQLGFSL